MPKAGAAAAAEQPPAADPFGGAAPPAAGAAGGSRARRRRLIRAKPEPLAIQMLRDSNPTTPVELMRRRKSTLQFGRPDESKRYLAELLAAKPADEPSRRWRPRLATFCFELARAKDVQPEGKQVADLDSGGGAADGAEPERIDALIPQLSGRRSSATRQAMPWASWSQAGPAIVTPMLRVLADTGREKEHRYIRAVLVRLGGRYRSAADRRTGDAQRSI